MIEYFDRNSIGPEDHAQRLAASCLLGSHLLYPEFIHDIVLYWLDNYSNYTDVGREEDMFNELVRQLLVQKPQLKLHAGEGMIHRSCNTYFYPSYVQLLGNGKHAWPMEYSESRWQVSFTEALKLLTQPHLEAFAAPVTAGVTGELELSGFVHNALLEFFYEPSFVLVTAYMLHLQALIAVTGAREPIDWLPRHYHSLKAIDEAALGEACCLSDKGRLDAMRQELRALHDVLNTPLLQKALAGVQALWSEKATYCWSQIFVRMDVFLSCQAESKKRAPLLL